MDKSTLPGDVVIRSLDAAGLDVLETILPRLSHYHNDIAATFTGVYPVQPYAKQLEETRKELAEDRALVEVVYRDGEPVGFSKGSIDDNAGFIDWLYLDEGLRGLGLGDILMERLFSYFRARRVHLVDLMVVAGNPAKSFYEKYGFATRLEMLSMKLEDQPPQPQ
ncbi:MAG: GNAT family N-acetyltransferase [Planctomycetaceae bacterium]|nr:GNAT family N-acetyltransferase [Planctomycetaceae bacterium]